ncbi:MAG: cobalamin biosynthesis protein [Hyphomicrobiales bacterium]|nr:cobalamin biosynthesis protein [Hyphomicrobiales bacterium]
MNMQTHSAWALGFGCQSHASAEAIVAAATATLARARAGSATLPVWQLFTIASKAEHAALHAAAAGLGVAIGFFTSDELQHFMAGTTRRSALVERLVGVGSVAEAAALAGAGPGSRLLVARTLHGGVTTALAEAAEGTAS